MGYLSLSDGNKFSFKCPVFNAETKMSSCIRLRNMFWQGQTPTQRKGCQTCMAAGKCPAAQIAQRMAMSGTRVKQPDDYGSTTPVTGKLRKDVLERILPVVVTQSAIQRHRPSPAELNLIETANERILTMLGSAPGASSKKSVIKGKPRRSKKLEPPQATETVPSKISQAAESGDLSAAL